MENLKELLMRRRSIRKYTDQVLTQDRLNMIMEAALVAPTSKNSRAWQFVVVDDKEMLAALATCKKFGAVALETATAAIVVTANTEQSEAWIEDTSIAATFMQLQAEYRGIGSCWVQIRERMYDDNITAGQYVKQLLSIPENIEVECIIALGYKNEQRKPYDAEKMMWEKVHKNKWEEK